MSELAEKVKASVERMKAFEPPEGYMLAFSGGKDSVVLNALADMAGVKYQAYYTVTSVDPRECICGTEWLSPAGAAQRIAGFVMLASVPVAE